VGEKIIIANQRTMEKFLIQIYDMEKFGPIAKNFFASSRRSLASARVTAG
jgi:hypothetical protein